MSSQPLHPVSKFLQEDKLSEECKHQVSSLPVEELTEQADLGSRIATIMSTSQPPPVSKYLEEANLSPECKDLLSSLPREIRYGGITCLYKGFWVLPIHLDGILACQQHFQAHNTDIVLVTTPKSGTTWLKAILFALLNRGQFHGDAPNNPLLTNNPHALVPFLEIDLYSDKQVPDLTSFTSPRLFATHMPFVMLPKSVKDSTCKLVYLCRDPKDTFVSLWHFLNAARPDQPISVQEPFNNFCSGASIYGPFWDHVLGYWKESLENPDKVLFLKYEQMKEQPAVQLRRLAEFMGCPFSQQEETSGLVDDILKLCSFENLRNLDVNKTGRLMWPEAHKENKSFFRRGEVGDWKNYLTSEMGDQLDRIYEQKFYGSGLKF